MKTLGTPWISHGFLTADFPAHQHVVWEFHVATGGAGVFVQAGRQDGLTAGKLVMSAPDQKHAIRVAESFSFYYIRFEPHAEDSARLAKLAERQARLGPLPLPGAQLDSLAAIRRKQEPGNPALQRSAELQFRSWLYELGEAGGEAPVRDGIDRSIDHMRAHLDRRLTLDGLAAIAGMDRFHYCRRFRQRQGLPPLAWFQAARIEAASFLLADPGIPLAEIARRFAFSDEFHFSKAFKARMGQPPGQFRAGI